MGIFNGGRDEEKIQGDGGREKGSLRDSGGINCWEDEGIKRTEKKAA
jgi:hypothetical protein